MWSRKFIYEFFVCVSNKNLCGSARLQEQTQNTGGRNKKRNSCSYTQTDQREDEEEGIKIYARYSGSIRVLKRLCEIHKEHFG
jgi:hypothetical protein